MNGPRDKFWMCFVEGGASPKHKHNTLEAATLEAKRLVRQTDSNVYILEAVHMAFLQEQPVRIVHMKRPVSTLGTKSESDD